MACISESNAALIDRVFDGRAMRDQPFEDDELDSMLNAARAEARADAFDDAAAIVRSQHKHGTKCETEAEWLQASYTFSNGAYLTREQAGIPHPGRATAGESEPPPAS